MSKIEKACPVVLRASKEGLDVLAFIHPSAGKQFVKGTIENGETPQQAAERELREESGLVVHSPMIFLGAQEIGNDRVPWHFFSYYSADALDSWIHATEVSVRWSPPSNYSPNYLIRLSR